MYDVVVIGSGPGGYVSAIRCAQLGLKTALVEKYSTLGGTCLNVGCIPSKALLDSSEHFYNATHHFKEHGIEVQGVKANFEQMIQRKNDVISQTCAGVKFLMDKNKIEVHHGIGSFINANTIAVKGSEGVKELQTKNRKKLQSFHLGSSSASRNQRRTKPTMPISSRSTISKMNSTLWSTSL